MTDDQLGSLFEKFADFYWSVPVSFVVEKISVWYPDVDKNQMERVLKRCSNDLSWHHCTIERDRTEEGELVVEHLLIVNEDDYDNFLKVRINEPLCEYDEETLFQICDYEQITHWDLPEINAINDFVKTEFELDDEWANDLVFECIFSQWLSLLEGDSWVMNVLIHVADGKMQFKTIEQVKRLRELGNSLYQVVPNPFLRGWKAMDLDNPLLPLDDIPYCDEDIPRKRYRKKNRFDPFGARELASEFFEQQLTETLNATKRKIGRNEFCPCGSGKKYKKCCGR